MKGKFLYLRLTIKKQQYHIDLLIIVRNSYNGAENIISYRIESNCIRNKEVNRRDEMNNNIFMLNKSTSSNFSTAFFAIFNTLESRHQTKNTNKEDKQI